MIKTIVNIIQLIDERKINNRSCNVQSHLTKNFLDRSDNCNFKKTDVYYKQRKNYNRNDKGVLTIRIRRVRLGGLLLPFPFPELFLSPFLPNSLPLSFSTSIKISLSPSLALFFKLSLPVSLFPSL